MKALPLMLTAMAAISISAPVLASEAPARSVDLRAAELNSQDGHKAIVQRLETAARQVCREPGLRGVARYNQEARCREDALQDALNDLHASGHMAASTPASARHVRVTLTSSSR